MSSGWSKKVLKSFNEAANNYNINAKIQQKIAWKLATECAHRKIPQGMWVDLGTGTGFLADALEKLHTSQKVIRLDGSEKMLKLHTENNYSQLWDLNLGLPKWKVAPSLIASSFALHWLSNPTTKLKEWYESLEKGGWLALALPIEESFPEWKLAAKSASVPFNGLRLPSTHKLIAALPKQSIHYQTIECITQRSHEVLSLLKPMRDVGAHISSEPALKISELRRLQKAWPNSKNNKNVELTWRIQLLLIQR